MCGYFLLFGSRVLVELAIPCKEQGVRVFEGFTVGFHPRSWEIVRNHVIYTHRSNTPNTFLFTYHKKFYTHRSKKLCSCQLKFHMKEFLL